MKKKTHFEKIFLSTPCGKMFKHLDNIFEVKNDEYVDFRVKLAYEVFIETCSNRSTLSSEKELSEYMQRKFIEKSKEIHGDSFDYDNIEFIDDKVKIFCNVHKDFILVKRSNHLNTTFENNPIRCKVCYVNSRRNNIDDIKTALTDIWENEYTYESFTEYKNATFKIPVTCKTHGVFMINYGLHRFKGVGCGECYRDISTRDNYLTFVRKIKNKIKKS